MELDGGKENLSWVFVEVLRNSQRFGGVDWRSGDKLDKLVCIFILIP